MLAVTSTFAIEETDIPPLKPGQVLVETKAFSISEEDIALLDLRFPVNDLVTDFSGVIVNLDHVHGPCRFSIGERVCGFAGSGGAMAQYAVCDVELLIPIPPRISYELAATVPDAWISAYEYLRTCARFEKRDSIAVYNAMSFRGQAVVQLAQLMGCRRVHCIVDTEMATVAYEHLSFRTALFDEVVVHGVTSETEILEQIAAYDPKGLEAVIDLRSKPYLHMDMLRPQGRAVITSQPQNKPNWLQALVKEIQIHPVRIRSQDPANYVDHCRFIETHIIPKIINESVNQYVAKQYDWEDAALAFEFARKNPNSVGKVICTIPTID